MSLYEVYAYTHIGSVKQHNEDHILMARFVKNSGEMQLSFQDDDDFLFQHGMLFAVADGIDGVAGAAVASRLALMTLERHYYLNAKQGNSSVCRQALQYAVNKANKNILHTAQQHPEFAHMGCTLAGVCLLAEGVLIFNGGDSRVYRYRHPILKPLTVDDTITQLAIRNGRMTLEEAENSEQRHCLTNYLGYERFTCVIEQKNLLRGNDILLICSDGLYNALSEEQLEAILQTRKTSLSTLGKQLANEIEKINNTDNISFILIRLDYTQ